MRVINYNAPSASEVLSLLRKKQAMQVMNPTWQDIKTVQSSNANVMKYVFSNENAVAESVLYKYPTYEERTVICCSTQSGCPVGCRFCGAGDAFVRSLTADEIVSQPVRLLNDTGVLDVDSIGRLQIMFMSMGEPLLNTKNLIPALRTLYAKYPKAALLISTIGPRIDYEPFLDVCEEIPTIGLQFSVHKSNDEERNELIPFATKLTLAEIAHMGERFFYRTKGRTPFFNYCAGPDNTSNADAKRLADLFNPEIWQATISVICERTEDMAAANARQRALAESFRSKLDTFGYRTRCFDPAGQDDIGGGCGQLWFVQKWMKDHPELARPSVGAGRPEIHTPLVVEGQ